MGGLGKLALAGAMAVLAAQSARGADLFGSPAQPDMIVQSDPSELGTGWYLRGDAGIAQDSIPLLSGSKNLAGWSVDLGAGYKFNNWLRADLSLDERRVQSKNTTLTTTQICPTGSSGGNNALQTLNTGPNGTPPNQQLGYVWDAILGSCTGANTNEVRSSSLLMNGFVDLGSWSGFTPYVGAGVGVARLQTTASVTYYNNADGSIYAPTAAQWAETGGTPLVWLNSKGQVLNPQPVNPGTNTIVSIATPPKWNTRQSSTRYNFAWALMGGIAYSLSDRAKLDLGFRYLNMGNAQTLPGTPSSLVTAKEVRLGLRYQID